MPSTALEEFGFTIRKKRLDLGLSFRELAKIALALKDQIADPLSWEAPQSNLSSPSAGWGR